MQPTDVLALCADHVQALVVTMLQREALAYPPASVFMLKKMLYSKQAVTVLAAALSSTATHVPV